MSKPNGPAVMHMDRSSNPVVLGLKVKGYGTVRGPGKRSTSIPPWLQQKGWKAP